MHVKHTLLALGFALTLSLVGCGQAHLSFTHLARRAIRPLAFPAECPRADLAVL
jgi:hypothetical protein